MVEILLLDREPRRLHRPRIAHDIEHVLLIAVGVRLLQPVEGRHLEPALRCAIAGMQAAALHRIADDRICRPRRRGKRCRAVVIRQRIDIIPAALGDPGQAVDIQGHHLVDAVDHAHDLDGLGAGDPADIGLRMQLLEDRDQAAGPEHVTQGVELDDQDAAPELVDARASGAFHALGLVEFAGF